jgi:hypothetical protein
VLFARRVKRNGNVMTNPRLKTDSAKLQRQYIDVIDRAATLGLEAVDFHIHDEERRYSQEGVDVNRERRKFSPVNSWKSSSSMPTNYFQRTIFWTP